MNFKLYSIEFLPSTNGWGSGELEFGKYITSVHAPNGAGKTPLLSGIVFCLGYKVSYREDIKHHCESIRLKFHIGESLYIVTRSLNDAFYLTAEEINNKYIFRNEGEFSDYFFNILCVSNNELTTSSGESTRLYTSTYLPCFWIDQLEGYSKQYFSPVKFIKDQEQEMYRIMLGLPPKNPYALKRSLILKRRILEGVNEELTYRDRIHNELETALKDDDDRDISLLRQERERINEKITELKDGITKIDQIEGYYDSTLNDKRYEIESHKNKISRIKARINSFKAIEDQINAEVDTLSLNDDSARQLRSFSEFCDNPKCTVFLNSEKSYGKSLLYLKDQLKDIQSNIEYLNNDLSITRATLDENESRIEKIEIDKSRLLKSHGFEGLMNILSQLTEDLVRTESSIKAHEKLSESSTKHVALLNKRELIHKEIDDLEGASRASASAAVKEIRDRLSSCISRWLDILETKNLHGNPSIDANFSLSIGDEKYTDFLGSTRIRIVLAFRAAMLEVASEIDSESNLGLLILDTPKQQEIDEKDLRNYFIKLEELAKRYKNIQIVFSSTEYTQNISDDDSLWLPTYEGKEQLMYLGN